VRGKERGEGGRDGDEAGEGGEIGRGMGKDRYGVNSRHLIGLQQEQGRGLIPTGTGKDSNMILLNRWYSISGSGFSLG
jgi:hypothetical protein